MGGGATLRIASGLLALQACQAQPPDLNGPSGTGADAGGADYADLIVSYTLDGITQTCSEVGMAVCGTQMGSCMDHPALGAPDGIFYELQPVGLLEVGFVCRPILDRVDGATPVPDFRILASGASDSNPGVVSISRDGDVYQTLGNLIRANQEFHITDLGFDYVRFVRIFGAPEASIQIDAIEALR